MSDEQQHGEQNAGYEKRDVSMWRITLFAILGVIVVVVSLVAVSEFFVQETETEVQESVLKPASISLQELRAREDTVLTSYAVIDTVDGRPIYRIPIERAMTIVAEEAHRARSEDR